MAGMNATKTDYWNFLFIELADPRTNDWFLIKSPVPTLTILSIYLCFVLSWGPKFMKDRKPFKLEKTLVVYNLFQVIISVWMVYEGFVVWQNYSWRCQPVDRSRTPMAYREARGVYVYYLAKITELLDTVFFVLRKNERQVTFLHVYHHSVMPMISWGTTKYFPGGHGTFIGFINSFVHIIMYTYYFLSAFGPKMQKYLWWKKYITNLQMIQFCMVFIHQTQLLYTDCNYPRWTVCFTLPNAIFFYFLFNDFYKKSYKKNNLENEKPSDLFANNNNNDSMVKNLNGPMPVESKKSL
ncbi:elongation of very long chain fatty acids protein [Lucilia sericata]|uniref:elongation of very long chain fatty acids protein n=1 Tax=Lucilia sericata TaxID=13632 RepID=UPI0018A851F5|nr:elongation of very long chain fatty acids protein [Lucilia sericata]